MSQPDDHYIPYFALSAAPTAPSPGAEVEDARPYGHEVDHARMRALEIEFRRVAPSILLTARSQSADHRKD